MYMYTYTKAVQKLLIIQLHNLIFIRNYFKTFIKVFTFTSTQEKISIKHIRIIIDASYIKYKEIQHYLIGSKTLLKMPLFTDELLY